VLRKMLTALACKRLASEDESYLEQLLERFGPGSVARANESSANSASSILTPRELAILELIRQAMANKRGPYP
jgi:LuxR family maltose regulon positive regulatory protein